MDPEKYLVCPFDESHIILYEKFMHHIGKCKRNHPNTDLKECPFNSTHYVKKSEFNTHVTECEDRSEFDYRLYEEASIAPPETYIVRNRDPRLKKIADNQNDEDWDAAAANLETYDPKKYAENAPVLRCPSGLTPSQRRQFREDEKRRLDAIRNRR